MTCHILVPSAGEILHKMNINKNILLSMLYLFLRINDNNIKCTVT